MRHQMNLSVEEMGEVRKKEMERVAQVLNLSNMVVLDLPDSGLPEMTPQDLEEVIEQHIEMVRPEVVVTYSVFGISGFPDHLVTHAVVKRAYCQMREHGAEYLQRLAMYTVTQENAEQTNSRTERVNIRGSKPEQIDAVVEVAEEDYKKHLEALDCYESYQSVIEDIGIKKAIGRKFHFEFFQEDCSPPVEALEEGLKEFSMESRR